MNRSEEILWISAAILKQTDKIGYVVLGKDNQIDWAMSRFVWEAQDNILRQLAKRLSELERPSENESFA